MVVDRETYFLPALADALDQLAGYLMEKGDTTGTSAVTTESTVVRRRFTSLPLEPDFLFEKIELEGDDKDDMDMKEEWETASEADTSTDAEVLAARTTIILQSNALRPKPEIQPIGNSKSSQVMNDRLVASTNNDISQQSCTSMSGAESSGLKISFEVNLSKRDILWILVGISSLVGILSVIFVTVVIHL
jgi:hypothetical protein